VAECLWPTRMIDSDGRVAGLFVTVSIPADEKMVGALTDG
jgi:hypothetical protein